MARRAISLTFVGALLFIGATPGAAETAEHGRYLGIGDFMTLAFGKARPEAQTLWITREHREPLERILGHRFGSLRVRYWQEAARTAWILDEIGKELPITIGVVVEHDAIRLLRILEFREVRGWEVRYPFFTDQFRGVTLHGDRELSAPIDGISGATLSVRAVTGVAAAALYLHEQVTERQ